MQVRIGIVQSPKEIDIELSDEDGQTVIDRAEEAISSKTMLWLTDKRGRRVGVAADKLAYIEVDSESSERRVGFSAL